MLRAALHENRATLALAAPICAGHVGQMLMGWADTLMVGRVGVVPLAASAFANTLLMVPLVFGFGFLMAVSVRAALGFGSGDTLAAGRSFRAGIWLATAIGLATAVVGAAVFTLLPIFGQAPEVNAEARVYFLLCLASATPAFISSASKNFCEALSRPWIPFWILLASVGLNVFLNWIFIFGNLGAPALGLAGAGLATLLARLGGAAAMVLYPFLSLRLRHAARGGFWGPEVTGEFRPLVRLGLPVGSMNLAEVCGFATCSLMMGWISVQALAAHQIALTCAATTFMAALGLAQALTVRVGQARGGRRTTSLDPLIVGGLGLTLGFMALCGAVFLFFNRPLAALFTDDPALLALAAHLLVIAGIFQIFDGLQVCAAGILRGFEDVKFPMLIGVAAYWVVGLPLGVLAAFGAGWGAPGIWSGLCAGLAFAACAFLIRLRILRTGKSNIEK